MGRPVQNTGENTMPSVPPARVVELRQYTLHPGQRDTLIDLFEREFVETQEAVGMQVIGTFRDLDDADRFVWLRGFADMSARGDALAAFYGGPVWQRHRDAANATMLDSDDVLLLRPARALAGFAATPAARPPSGTRSLPPGLITATICPLAAPLSDAVLGRFEAAVQAHAGTDGAELVAWLVSETAPNNFPRLPVREGEPMAVWFSRCAGADAQRAHAARLADSPAWRAAWPAWRECLAADPHTLRLAPTARSTLHG
jgi:hypothetical protein